MTFATVMFIGIEIWGSIGAVIAIGFLAYGLDRIDEDAHGILCLSVAARARDCTHLAARGVSVGGAREK